MHAEAHPTVSVIVPTRDREKWLPRALLSALGQKEIAAEIIVVDDGSQVPVERRLTDFARSRCKVVRFEHPRGVATARNAGVASAGGEWLAFLDDDDVWAPTKLARVLDVAVRSGADFAFSGGVLIDADGSVLHAQAPSQPDHDFHRAMLRSLKVPYPSSNLVVKASVARSVGGFDEHLMHIADWDLLIRLSASATPAMTPEYLLAYTLHGTNMQRRGGRALAQELRRVQSKYAPARAQLGVSIDRAWWLQWRAGASRLAGNRFRAGSAYVQLGWLERDLQMIARGVVMAAGGEPALAATRRVAATRNPAEEWPTPPWLHRAVHPPPPAIAAIWL